jgi:hypothetical protein
LVDPGNFATRIGENRTYSRNTRPGSPYFDLFNKAVKFHAAEERNARLPDIVAVGIEKVLARRHPRLRYVIGSPLEMLGLWSKRVLPAASFEYVFQKFYLP